MNRTHEVRGSIPLSSTENAGIRTLHALAVGGQGDKQHDCY